MKVQSYLKGLSDHWAKGHSYRTGKVFTKNTIKKRKPLRLLKISGMAKPIFPMHAYEKSPNAIQQKIRESRPMQKMRKKTKNLRVPNKAAKARKSKISASPDQ